jgi:putative SOS response-associated peptidase YedK
MCGRFTRYLSRSEIVRLYSLTAPAETAYSVAPTDPVPFRHRRRERRAQASGGPLVARSVVGEGMPKAAMFNARSETLDTSGAFKDAFASKRCLIPADGFYEWIKSPAVDGKDPWHIFLPGPQPFSFAGL